MKRLNSEVLDVAPIVLPPHISLDCNIALKSPISNYGPE